LRSVAVWAVQFSQAHVVGRGLARAVVARAVVVRSSVMVLMAVSPSLPVRRRR
jgi:hypothetical protein